MKKMLLVMGLCWLAGCATAPSPAQIDAGDRGPLPENYKEIVQGWIHATLKDPYSVQDLEITRPVPAAVYGKRAFRKFTVWAWQVDFSLNAKNGFGGYAGLTRYSIWVRDGKVIRSSLDHD